MDTLTAAVQRVEAQRGRDGEGAPQPSPPARSASDRPVAHGVRIPTHQQQPPPLVDPLQQPWHEPMDGPRRGATPCSPPATVTTPTMRITDILNDEPMEGESDDPDVVFVGAAAAALPPQYNNAVRLMNPRERAQWRNTSHEDLASASASTSASTSTSAAVSMRSGARLSNGDVSIAAGGGFTGISWPPGVQRSNVFDSRAAKRATGGSQQQRPAVAQYPPHTREPLQQASTKPAAKRERAPKSRAVPPPAAVRQQPPVARATNPVFATNKTTKTDTASTNSKREARKMWTEAEKAMFDEGARVYGSDWNKIAELIGTRPRKSVANYARRVRESAAKAAASKARSRGSNSSGIPAAGVEVQHDVTLEEVNGKSSTEPSVPGLAQQGVLVDEPVDAPAEPMAVRVLDLSSKEPPQRPRRGVRHQETTFGVRDTTAFALAPAQPSAPAAAVANDVIEINTEESATETPQKAPQRVVTRPPRAREQRRPVSATANNNNNEVVVKQPKRKKPKLTLNLSSGGALEAPPASPSPSSVTSGSGLIGSSALKPKKRGKKRPQQEFDGITDSPAMAFSSYSYSSISDDGRKCEFCNIARGVCATMYCTQCKRLYHTKCLVNHFRPHCQIEGGEPIEAQLEALRLDAPPQVNVKMLRCAPCHAVVLDNIKRDGYAWDCDCPSCREPQRLVDYRREMVIQFLVHRIDEKPPKAKSKAGSKQTGKDNASGTIEAKKPVVQPTRMGTRRTRNNSSAVVPGSENESMEVDSEASVEVLAPVGVETKAVAATSGKKQSRGSKKREESNGSAVGEQAAEMPVSEAKETGGDDEDGGPEEDSDEPSADAVVEPDQEKETSSSRLPSLSKSSPAAASEAERDIDADVEPELTDEELLAAVPVAVDGNFETFQVVCTETPSLTASGVMKEGRYHMHHRDHPARDFIFCPCCEKHMPREQFVRHTDGAFLSSEDTKTPWDFLFARHYDGSASPLQRFLQILDQHRSRNKKKVGGGSLSSSKKSPKKTLSAADGVKAGDVVETAESLLKTSLKQLESVFIARRAPGSADSKASNSSSSSSGSGGSNSKPAFVIRLVCVSSELTIPMHDGLVQNKLDRSTPGDFPYKDGWLFFDKGSHGTGPSTAVSPSYAHVLCNCCAREMDLGDFILHTGVVTRDLSLKFKRRYVYVPQCDNPRALLDLDRIWQAILTLYKHQALDDFMSSVPSVALRL